MFGNYSNEPFESIGLFKQITFERKLENETAFDGIVKIYSLRCDNDNITQLLDGQYFHRFLYPTKNGVLLRQFKSKTSWPRTRLVYLNIDTQELTIIEKTKSSYDSWTVIEDGTNLIIKISPSESIIFPDK